MSVRIREGSWHYRFQLDGHEYSGSTGLAGTQRNKSAAVRSEAKARELVQAGRGHELRLEIRPFNEAAEDFLTWAEGEHRDSPRTATRLRTSFSSLILHFGAQPVSAILAGHVERYKSWRRTEHQVRDVTIRHDLHALSKAFKYWKRLNWCRSNPVADVEIPSDKDAVREHILTAAEELIYCEYLRVRNPDLYDFARLMLATAARPWEELACLRKEHVDLVQRTIRIVESKSRAGRRIIPLTAEAIDILGRRLTSAGPWVFPSPRKSGMHLQTLNKGHARAMKDTGLAFVLYDLRHTAATRWAEAGMPIAILAKTLGHADLRSVMKYVHVRPEAQRAAMDQFEVRSVVQERKGIVQ